MGRIDLPVGHRAPRAGGRRVDRSLRHLAPRDRGEGGGGAGRRRSSWRRARASSTISPPGSRAPRRRSASGRRRRACAATAARSRFGSAAAFADDVAELVAGVPDARLSSSAPHPLWVDRPRAGHAAWYELFPRSFGGLKGAIEHLSYVADLGFDVVYLPADPPDRHDPPQGPGQQPGGRSRRPGQPLGHRRPRRRPRCGAPRARHHRGLRRLRRRRRGPRPRGGARLRAAVQPGPPLGPRPPRVVPAAARWLDPLRREPAEEVPGHPPDRLLAAPTTTDRVRAVGGVPRRARALDRPRRPHVPGGQPAHEAAGVLGVGDPRRAEPPPRGDLPRRGVHRRRR